MSNEFLVKTAGDWFRSRGNDGRNVDASTVTVDAGEAVDALATERIDVISLVRIASIAFISDKVESEVTHASSIFVDFVSTTDRRSVVGKALAVSQVVPEYAHALAEDVVINLQIGAVELNWVGSLGFWQVSICKAGLYLVDLGLISLSATVCEQVGLTVCIVGVFAGGQTDSQE